VMSGYSSSAWLDTSHMNVAVAANSRSRQLYADVECMRPAAPFTSCRPQPPPPHHVHCDVKQLQQSPAFTGVTHVLVPPDMSAYCDDTYPVYGSYSVYPSCRRDCSPPAHARAAVLTVHGRLGDSRHGDGVLDGTSDLQHECSDGEHVDSVSDQQLSASDNGLFVTQRTPRCLSHTHVIITSVQFTRISVVKSNNRVS